jgi:hypothetical protein
MGGAWLRCCSCPCRSRPRRRPRPRRIPSPIWVIFPRRRLRLRNRNRRSPNARRRPRRAGGAAVGDGAEDVLRAGLAVPARVHRVPHADAGGRHPAEQQPCSATGRTSTGTRWIRGRWTATRSVMGPASVLYGSDAIGGAVNAIGTAPPEWTGQAVWERTLGYRGATADESHQVRAATRGRVSERLGFVGRGDVEAVRGPARGARRGRAEKDGLRRSRFRPARGLPSCGRRSADAGPPAGGPGRRLAHAPDALRHRSGTRPHLAAPGGRAGRCRRGPDLADRAPAGDDGGCIPDPRKRRAGHPGLPRRHLGRGGAAGGGLRPRPHHLGRRGAA